MTGGENRLCSFRLSFVRREQTHMNRRSAIATRRRQTESFGQRSIAIFCLAKHETGPHLLYTHAVAIDIAKVRRVK